MQENWVRSLGQEDPLEKEIATYSSTLAWKIPWTEKAGRLQSMGSQRVGHDWATSLHFTSLEAYKRPANRKDTKYETNSWGKSSSSVSLSVTGRYTSILKPVEIKLLNQKLSTSCIFHDKIALRPNSFVAKCLWKTFTANKFMEKTSDVDTHPRLTLPWI